MAKLVHGVPHNWQDKSQVGNPTIKFSQIAGIYGKSTSPGSNLKAIDLFASTAAGVNPNFGSELGDAGHFSDFGRIPHAFENVKIDGWHASYYYGADSVQGYNDGESPTKALYVPFVSGTSPQYIASGSTTIQMKGYGYNWPIVFGGNTQVRGNLNVAAPSPRVGEAWTNGNIWDIGYPTFGSYFEIVLLQAAGGEPTLTQTNCFHSVVIEDTSTGNGEEVQHRQIFYAADAISWPTGGSPTTLEFPSLKRWRWISSRADLSFTDGKTYRAMFQFA